MKTSEPILCLMFSEGSVVGGSWEGASVMKTSVFLPYSPLRDLCQMIWFLYCHDGETYRNREFHITSSYDST